MRFLDGQLRWGKNLGFVFKRILKSFHEGRVRRAQDFALSRLVAATEAGQGTEVCSTNAKF